MNNKTLNIIIVLFGLILLSGVGYWFTQRENNAGGLAGNKTTVTATPTASPDTSPSSIPTKAQGSENKTVVVYEQESQYPAGEKEQLQKRVVDPLVDYYVTEAKDPAVSVKITLNSKTSRNEAPYLVDFILKSGVYGGSVIRKNSNTIEWWYPECMGGCNLTSAYKTKYPEVAKLTE